MKKAKIVCIAALVLILCAALGSALYSAFFVKSPQDIQSLLTESRWASPDGTLLAFGEDWQATVYMAGENRFETASYEISVRKGFFHAEYMVDAMLSPEQRYAGFTFDGETLTAENGCRYTKSDAELPEIQREPRHISIDLSGVKETHIQGDAVEPLNLQILFETENHVESADAWYQRTGLSLPMMGDGWDSFYDETYEYCWDGSGLDIFDRETGDCLYVLDYPTDRWFMNGNNAYLKDGVFYGVSMRNGYAQPDTCFLFAYDLEQERLLWRSADQTCNSMNFLVRGNVILCGYGFTEEADYLYQISLLTGEVLDRTPLRKMPDLLAEQDSRLYVHTYSYDYVMTMD